ncbi:ABC transporter permease [Nocardiopsis nanhaiensis]
MLQRAEHDDPPRRAAPRRVVALRTGLLRRAPVLAAASVAVAAFVLVPLVYLVLRAFERGFGLAVDHVVSERTAELLWRTGLLAGTVTVACLVIGVACAWLIARSDLPFRRTMGVLFALPLATPTLVAAPAWISIWPEIAGFTGVFLVLTLGTYPYVMLPVMAALRSGDLATEEVARSLGKGAVRTFFLVTVRGVRPAVLAGGLLVTLYTLADFAAPSLMRYETLTINIFVSYRSGFDRTPAAIFACVLVLVAAVIMIAERRARGRAARFGQVRVGTGVMGRPPVVPLGRARWPAFLASVALLVAAIGVPVATVAGWFVAGNSRGFHPDRLVDATVNTLAFSAMGALAAVVLAFPVALLAARHDGRFARFLESISYIGYALPGITIGLAFVFVGIRLVPGWYQETPLLILAYGVLFLPLAIAGVRAGVAAAPPRLEEVSRSLGKGSAVTHARVTLPLATPGIAAGVALVFLTAAKELPATLLLRPTGDDTLATQMWALTNRMLYGAAAPYALALILIAMIPALVLGFAVIERTNKERRTAARLATLIGTNPRTR